MNLLKDESNARYMLPKIIGFVLVCLGVFPFLLWLVQETGFLVPEGADSGYWDNIIMAVVMLALGLTLISEKGAQITEAFFSWFSRKGGG